MTKRSLATGLLLGVAIAGNTATGWNDALQGAFAAQGEISPPVLPVEIVTADEDYNGTLMNSVLLSYWAPLLQLVREDYPDATRRQALRPRGYEIGGDEIQGQSGLLEEVHASAREKGWKPVPKYSFDSAVFSMRGYELDGKVFALAALTDFVRVRDGAVTISFDQPPASGEFDLVPAVVFTNLEHDGGSSPWIHPEAPILTFDQDSPRWLPREGG